MNRYKLLYHNLLLIMLLTSSFVSARTITDMADRTLEIPEKINRILTYDAKTTIFIFSVGSEKLCAKTSIPGSNQHRYIHPSYNSLPEVDIKNIEEVLQVNPQIIIAGSYPSQNNLSRINQLQERTHIPVIMIDLSIHNTAKTYEFLGELLQMKDECKKRIDFINKTMSRIKPITIGEKPGIYYTIGQSGLMTDPSGSKHTEIIDFLKLNNVADVKIPTGGHAKVNMEQVLLWNPEYIFCAGFKGNKNAYDAIKSEARWQSIHAVKSNKVFKVPSEPFGWLDHPPSVNRIPGLIWLHSVTSHPSVDIKKEICEFYELFYHYTLNDNEYLSLFVD